MQRFFLTMTILVASLAGVIGAAAVPVGAQEETATPTETPVGDRETIALSPTTSVDSWRFENGTFQIRISSQVPMQVTVTDAGKLAKALSDGGGAASTRVRQRTASVGRGTTTIEFRATEHEDAYAVTLAASNGDALAVIRTDSMGSYGAVKWDTAAGLVLAAAAGTGLWTYRKAKERWEDEKKEVERIA